MSADDAPITDPISVDASADPTPTPGRGERSAATTERRTAAYWSMRRTMDELST